MNLFDMVQNEEPGGPPCRLCGMPFDFCDCKDEPPRDDELEARFLGEERAGIPSWSRSAATITAALAALLASVEGERRAQLAAIEEESYMAARRRKLARVAMDAELEAV